MQTKTCGKPPAVLCQRHGEQDCPYEFVEALISQATEHDAIAAREAVTAIAYANTAELIVVCIVWATFHVHLSERSRIFICESVAEDS